MTKVIGYVKDKITDEIEEGNIRKLVFKGIVGLLVALYLAGMITEILNGGNTIITGQRYALKFTMNPFKVIYIALTQGIVGIIIVLGLSSVGYYYYLLHTKFKDGEKLDERNIYRAESDSQGSSDWMPSIDIKRNFEHTFNIDKTKGTIVGMIDNKVLAQREFENRNKNSLLVGSAGTGKSSCVAIPLALQAIKRGESMIFTDPKGELFSSLLPILEKYGKDYDIKVFNLKNPEYSDGWDCLGEINGDIDFATTFANTIITNTSADSNKDGDFWSKGEMNLLKGLLLRADAERDTNENKDLKRKKIAKAETIQDFPKGTLPRLYAELIEANDDIDKILDESTPQQPWYSSFALFSQGTEVVRQSNVFGLGVRLGVLQSPAVSRMLSTPDISLTAPAERKCAYFLIMDDQDKSKNFLSSLFFASFFTKVVRYADSQPNKKCKVPVNLILDEFMNIGKIPDFQEKLSTVRSRGINIAMLCQSIGQIKIMYPDDMWHIIVGNCATKILLGSGDPLTNEFFSDLCGVTTIKTKGQKIHKNTFDVFEMHHEYNEEHGESQRNLMNPDEIGTMKPNESLVNIIGEKPLKVNKFHYSMHPLGKGINKENLITVEEYMAKRRTIISNKEDFVIDVMAEIDSAIGNNELTLDDSTDTDNNKQTKQPQSTVDEDGCYPDDYENDDQSEEPPKKEGLDILLKNNNEFKIEDDDFDFDDDIEQY